jgi:peptide/nickel transport system permease protein
VTTRIPVDATALYPAAPDGDGVARSRPARRVPGQKLWRALRHNRKALAGALLLLFFLVLAVFPGQIAPYNPNGLTFAPGLGPSAAHWLGTTSQGQDILSQLVWGARQTLIIAFAAGGISTVLSVIVGVSAAYLGGVTDGGLSLLTDVLLVIPTFPLIIVVAAYLNNAGTVDIILVLGFLGWPYGARQLRSQVLSLRNRDFLQAARVRGERASYIIVGEITPTLTSLIVATFLGSAAYAVLAAAALQFIGLGDPNALSWGTMLYWAQSSEALQAGMPLWAIMPGLFVAGLGAAFALLNYAFDEISNPALRPVKRLSRVPFTPLVTLPVTGGMGAATAGPNGSRSGSGPLSGPHLRTS